MGISGVACDPADGWLPERRRLLLQTGTSGRVAEAGCVSLKAAYGNGKNGIQMSDNGDTLNALWKIEMRQDNYVFTTSVCYMLLSCNATACYWSAVRR